MNDERLEQTHTRRSDANLMPWNIRAGDDGVTTNCILVATMNGGEMQAVSLHVDPDSWPD